MTLDIILRLTAVIAFVVILVALEAIAVSIAEIIKETSEEYLDKKLKERTGDNKQSNKN